MQKSIAILKFHLHRGGRCGPRARTPEKKRDRACDPFRSGFPEDSTVVTSIEAVEHAAYQITVIV